MVASTIICNVIMELDNDSANTYEVIRHAILPYFYIRY